jgi:uncharacterized membrane protein
MSNLAIKITGKTNSLVRLSLSAESTRHSVMFFSLIINQLIVLSAMKKTLFRLEQKNFFSVKGFYTVKFLGSKHRAGTNW